MNYAEDMDFTGTELVLSGRNLIFDLRDHSISCSRGQLVHIKDGTNLTVQNGSMFIPKISADSDNEFKFWIFRGKLSLKNMKIDADAENNKDG